MTFYVGQKVVCVDATQPPLAGKKHLLIEGNIYTVTGVGLLHPLDPEKLPCIRLAELDDSHNYGSWAHRFRPLVTRSTETGMAILRELLNTNPADSRLKEAI